MITEGVSVKVLAHEVHAIAAEGLARMGIALDFVEEAGDGGGDGPGRGEAGAEEDEACDGEHAVMMGLLGGGVMVVLVELT